jgi:C4-dicarboxylate transporter DctM subunit
MKLTIGTILILGLIIFSAPLFVLIVTGAGLGLVSIEEDLALLFFDIFRLTESSVLMTLPLFAFAGFLLSEAKTADRLIRLSEAAVGWLPGGLVLISLLTCAFFTMLTGGSGVTIVAVGALLYPALTRSNYKNRFSLGLITCSGDMGLLLPPSIPLILYGVIAQQMEFQVKMADLFLAGLLPALLMIVVLYGYGVFANRKQKIELKPFNFRRFVRSVWESKWELLIPVVVLGGIYSGTLVISDAAAVTALYVFLITVVVKKEIRLKQIPGIAVNSMKMVGSILLILAVALAFSSYLISADIPMRLVEYAGSVIDTKWKFLLLLNILLLALGAILDIYAAIIIMVPLILPLAVGYDIDPVHLGIIFVANMQLGYFTPPVGMNLFIASSRFKKSITELYRATLPFLAILFVVVLLITYVPWLSMAFIRSPATDKPDLSSTEVLTVNHEDGERLRAADAKR